MERNSAGAAEHLIVLNSETELRPVQQEDAEELYALIDRNRTRLRRWLPWATPEYSLADVRHFLALHAKENAEGTSFTTVIRHRGAICGCIGLHRIDRVHRNTSIGYWIDEAHEGKGFVTAACRAMITAGFREFGLHRIEIRCATWNNRSSSIPRKLEFLEEAILREAEWLHDRYVDLRVFSMLEQDWKG
ncbi:MAG TPA: GNAT family protein [Bryobacteraceae bacterium]|nr:GNAT family protein [Bryobacteraceae bacterium]